jgi:hypothetical protein
MSSETNVQGNQNVVIQQVTGSTITVNVNGDQKEIGRGIGELRELMSSMNRTMLSYAEKSYHIEDIDDENFSTVTSKRVFNGTLVKKLVESQKDKESVKRFLETLPIELADTWVEQRSHLTEAQQVLENNYVWVISESLRRLFAIANEKSVLEEKMEKYVRQCFETYKIVLQLSNCLLISALWDAKKGNSELNTRMRAVEKFFGDKLLTESDLRYNLKELCMFFQEKNLPFPVDKWPAELNDALQNPESSLNRAAQKLEELGNRSVDYRYRLGQCHTAEISLATVIEHFPFLGLYKLVTIRRVEYESFRNTRPRYIKDYTILEKKESSETQRLLKYDSQPVESYALLFHRDGKHVNLFPFVLDYHTLTNADEFQIYLYSRKKEKRGLSYFSIQSEKECDIFYSGINDDSSPSKPLLVRDEAEKQKKEEQIKCDLVLLQFQEAMNTLLDSSFCFEKPVPVADNSSDGI